MSLVNDILKELEKSDNSKSCDPTMGHGPVTPRRRRRRSVVWVSALSVGVIILSACFFVLALYLKRHNVSPRNFVSAVKHEKKVSIVKKSSAISAATAPNNLYSLALPVRPTRTQLMRAMAHDLDLVFGMSLYDDDMLSVSKAMLAKKSIYPQLEPSATVASTPPTNVSALGETGVSKPLHITRQLAQVQNHVTQQASVVEQPAPEKQPEVTKSGTINEVAVAANWLDKDPEKKPHLVAETSAQIELQMRSLAKKATAAIAAEDTHQFNAMMMSLLVSAKKNEKIAVFMRSLTEQNNYLVATRAINFLLHHDSQHDLGLVQLAASFYLKQGETLKAVNMLQRHTPTIEGHTDYFALLAYSLLKMKDYKDSMMLYKQLLSIDNQQASWWLGLGIDFQGVSDSQQALYAYRMALKYAPEHTAYRYYITDKIKEILAGSA